MSDFNFQNIIAPACHLMETFPLAWQAMILRKHPVPLYERLTMPIKRVNKEMEGGYRMASNKKVIKMYFWSQNGVDLID